MRTLIVLFFGLTSFNLFADTIIHPMEFDGTEFQKNKVIQIIKRRVYKDYCEGEVDMCQESILRMMENENLQAFKKASKATNRKIMDRVLQDYCKSGIDMCNYSTIWMMYEQNLAASKKSLSW